MTGRICVDSIYTLQAFKERLQLTEEQFLLMQKRGLKFRYLGDDVFVRGGDFQAFLLERGKVKSLDGCTAASMED